MQGRTRGLAWALASVCTLGCVGDPPALPSVGESSGGESTAAAESTTAIDGTSTDGTTTDGTTLASTTATIEPPAPPVLGLSLSPIKRFTFEWAPAADVDTYELLESGASCLEGLAAELPMAPGPAELPLHCRRDASYQLQACNTAGCSDSEPVSVADSSEAIGYVKSDYTLQGAQLGYSVAVSRDGSTLAVGAPSQPNVDVLGVGVVHVFVRNDVGEWAVDASIDNPSPALNDNFGFSVALSDDGQTLLVGAPNDDTGLTNGGTAYLFARYELGQERAQWGQERAFQASSITQQDQLGWCVAMSGDGSTLAVGVPYEDSAATTVNGSTADMAVGFNAGAVYVFERDALDPRQWLAPVYVKSPAASEGDTFGCGLALSQDGGVLAVGAPFEDAPSDGGAVYIYERSAPGQWSSPAVPLEPSNIDNNDGFGQDVSLSADGNVLAVGAPFEDGDATGMDATGNDDSGAVYVFVRGPAKDPWPEPTFLKASDIGIGAGDRFGHSLALSGDGTMLAVGAPFEDGSGTGVGAVSDEAVAEAGAVYVIVPNARGQWSNATTIYVKATDTSVAGGDVLGDQFGHDVALDQDGRTLAIGAPHEDGALSGLEVDEVGQSNDGLPSAGAAYLF